MNDVERCISEWADRVAKRDKVIKDLLVELETLKQPPTRTWTDAPTKPGWYWLKTKCAPIQVVHIVLTKYTEDLYCESLKCAVAGINGQWQAIEPPGE